jgi:hypothetical protein
MRGSARIPAMNVALGKPRMTREQFFDWAQAQVREYAAVASLRRYVILEHTSIGLTVLERSAGDQPWIITTLTAGDTLRMVEIGIEIPVVEFYEDTDVLGTDIPGAASDTAAADG